MREANPTEVFDYIIVGSGTSGATLARELSKQDKRILLLEKGEKKTLKETVFTMASILNEVPVANKLKDARVIAVGGSTAMYLAVAEEPPIDAFGSMGIDLNNEYAAVQQELPMAELADALLTPQAIALRDSALKQGHAWKKNPMLVDQPKCDSSYSYDAKWKAIDYVDEAVGRGVVLQTNASVENVVVENGKAVGVDCKISLGNFRSKNQRFMGRNIILSAGSLATPLILRKSGLKSVMKKGFFFGPSVAVIGRVPGMKGINGFAGAMGMKLDNGTALIDANLHKLYFVMGMIQSMKLLRIPFYAEHVAIMVKANEEVSGELSEDGRYHKELTQDVHDRLKEGEAIARGILLGAGAKNMFTTPVMTGGSFGTVRINEDVGNNLETGISNLFVCDGSLIPHNARVTPTVTLVCLSKYLANQFLNAA